MKIKMKKEELILKLNEEMKQCKKCPLHLTRTNVVPGEYNINAKIMFIGEAPGKNEDLQGRPFVGAAGKNLDEALKKISLERKEVFITSILKCRPPNNRNPKKEEIIQCSPWLEKQIKIINPKIIVLMGNFALKYFFEKYTITQVHGKILKKKYLGIERTFIPIFHPAAIIYNQKIKETYYKDFEKIKETLKKNMNKTF